MDNYEKKKVKKNYSVKTNNKKKKNTSVSNLNEIIKKKSKVNDVKKK